MSIDPTSSSLNPDPSVSDPKSTGRTPSAPTAPDGRGNPAPTIRTSKSRLQIFEILLVYVLLLGAYLRLTPYIDKGDSKLKWGTLWGESQWLHPDERFLLYVSGAISPMKDVPVDPENPNGATKRVWYSLSDYFNTPTSTLNPNNQGYSFFVYGTLPIFLTRYIAEVAFNHQVGWNEIASVGRPLSALSDLLVIVLVFLAASRLFNKRVGLLAAAFYSCAVLPIQLSHFYKEDTYTNFFTFLAIYFAILVSTSPWRKLERRSGKQPHLEAAWDVNGIGEGGEPTLTPRTANERMPVVGLVLDILRQPLFLYSLGFGVALGCAVASKILAAPVAVILPVAFGVGLLKLPREQRAHRWGEAALYILVAALASLLVFRIFQPYAFKGPGFFGVGINRMWLEGILSQRGQTDFPPAMQWARRPITFAIKNLTVWGLGLPLSLLAWAGFLWAGWRMIKGEWSRHAIPWFWTLGYFGFQMWQSHFNPSMRYFLPMYPTLVIFAAWLLVWLYDRRNVGGDREGGFGIGAVGTGGETPPLREGADRAVGGRGGRRPPLQGWLWRIIAIVVGVFVLGYTFLYAYGFSRLYTRPITRLEASRWIYQNVPGPIVLHFETQDGLYNQPVPVSYNYYISHVTPYAATFRANQDGSLVEVSLNNLTVLSSKANSAQVTVTVIAMEDASATGSISIDTSQPDRQYYQDYTLSFESPLAIQKGVMYRVNIAVEESGISFSLQGDMIANEGDWDDGIPYPIDGYSAYNGIYPLKIPALEDYYTSQGVSYADLGDLTTPNFNMYWEEDNAGKYERFIRILDATEYIFITSNRQWGSLPRIPERFPMTTIYYRNLLGCPSDQDIVWCYSVAKPGMYQGNLGFELVATFTSNSSIGPFELNDQFAEEAFTVYDHPKVLIFRKTPAYDSQAVADLLGTLDWSKTIHVFPDKAGSYPADLMLPTDRLEEQQQGGTWSQLFNAQAIYNRIQSLGVVLWYVCLFLLGLMTYPLLRLALPGLPDRGYPLARTAGLLLLTWLVWVAGSARIPFSRLTITVVLLILAIAGGVLGYLQRRELAEEWRTRRKYFLMIELVLLAFFLFDLYLRLGNPDLWHPWKGGEKPMDFAYFNAVLKSTTFPPYDPWHAGGYLNYYYYGFVFVGVLVKWLGIVPSIAYNLILPTLFSLTAMGAFSVAWNLYVKWADTKENTKENTKEATKEAKNTTKGTKEEAKGAIGEAEEAREDAEGPNNIGTQGAVALEAWDPDEESYPGAGAPQEIKPPVFTSAPQPRWGSLQKAFTRIFHSGGWSLSMPVKVGLMAAVFMVVLGNLGTVGMIVVGLARLGSPSGQVEDTPITSQIGYVIQGTVKVLRGERLPYAPGEWYWNPSRVIPAQGDTEPITEFPYFTFLYADLHAHMMAMPVAFLALAWAVSLVLGPWGRRRGYDLPEGRTHGFVLTGEHDPLGRSESGHSRVSTLVATGVSLSLSFFIGALASGALYPINLSDRYTYLALGAVAVAYSFWRFVDIDQLGWLPSLPKFSRRALVTAAGVILFVGLTLALYSPYNAWYGQAYGSVDWWKGPRTQIGSYLVHWGLFLFILVSWMFWETRDWMAHTPLSAVRKLAPYMSWIFAAFFVLVLFMTVQQTFVIGLLGKVYVNWMHVSIVWLVVPLAAWAGVLILRPGQPESKRVVLFLTGTGLAITLLVDTVVARGDIGRMNTVFKFYLQVWGLFAVCAAAALAWLWGTIKDWLPSWRISWKIVLVGLLISAGLYTLIAGRDKVTDRMARYAQPAASVPLTLDGMAYMQYSTYDEGGKFLDLSRDYFAISWMQENITGSPVIVEAATGNNYRWFGRFSIYTGLPSVLGWEWHQMQQRALLPSTRIHERMEEVMNFYLTFDTREARKFLQKYNVRYIILGQLERAVFSPQGLQKFTSQEGHLWRQVYPPVSSSPAGGTATDLKETIIYEVVQP